MSTAWACIYRKNTPGYPNPWDLCADEVNSIFRCSQPLYNLPLTVGFSGYTLGTPNSRKADLVMYANSSGIYEVLVTTGSSPTGCSGAFVQLNLTLAGTPSVSLPDVPASNQFLTTGFTVNSTGYASGIFPLPFSNINSTVSGIVAAFSGKWTGVFNVLESLNVFPVPPVT